MCIYIYACIYRRYIIVCVMVTTSEILNVSENTMKLQFDIVN